MATTRVPQRIEEGGPPLVDRRQAGGAHGCLRADLGRRVRAPVEPDRPLPGREGTTLPRRPRVPLLAPRHLPQVVGRWEVAATTLATLPR